jgi:hypothetical protein
LTAIEFAAHTSRSGRCSRGAIGDVFMDQQLLDRLAIRDLVENWAVWRDAGDWERFATVWHEEGWMSATWFQGPARDFMRVSQEGFAKGAPVHGVLCDVVCTGRFYDFLEKRQGKWGIVRRQPIYEKDRIDPVDPSATLQLDQKALAALPEGYRHLAYMQELIGYKVKRDMPGLTGPEVEKLYAEGREWLAGKAN